MSSPTGLRGPAPPRRSGAEASAPPPRPPPPPLPLSLPPLSLPLPLPLDSPQPQLESPHCWFMEKLKPPPPPLPPDLPPLRASGAWFTDTTAGPFSAPPLPPWPERTVRSLMSFPRKMINWYSSFDGGMSGFFLPSVPKDFTRCRAIVLSSVLIVYSVPSYRISALEMRLILLPM